MNNITLNIVFFSFFLVSCSSQPKQSMVENSQAEDKEEPLLVWQEDTAEDDKNKQEKEFIEQLLPAEPELIMEESRFDVSANNTPVKIFLMSLVHDTDYNLIADEGLEGNVSLNLKNVTVLETLEAIKDVYGYDYVLNSYGIQVLPLTIQTRIFPINYLNVSRTGSSGMWVSSGQITSTDNNESSDNSNSTSSSTSAINSTQVNTNSSSDFWGQLKITLDMMIAGREDASIVVDPQAGMVVVRGMPKTLQGIEEFLERAELSVGKQVLIEAKILEVSLNEGFQSGIQWNTFGAGRAGTATDTSRDMVGSMASELLTNTDEIGGVFNMNFDYDDFTGVIELLETQGEVKVLSSPRISTVNNQKAVIKVGNDEYFVTELKSSTTTSGGNSTSFPEIIFTPFFSGIALDVTPQIGENKDVILHVHPTITEVSERQKNVVLSSGTLTVPLAFSSVRETDSIIRAKSGQVVVIGGLMQNQKRTLESGIPYLRDIPIIGALFGQNRESIVQSELVILIQPRVVDSNFHYEEMKRINKRFSGFNKGRKL
ncbi:MAG: pilus (MSHA type) biogenesis protein MshL [Oleispira sp.]